MRRITGSLIASAAAIAATSLAAAPSPVADWEPDYIYHGEPAASFISIGDVDWSSAGHEIIARPRPGGKGGWLILPLRLQDVAAYAEFRCAASCEAGIQIRSSSGAEGQWDGTLARFGTQSASVTGVSVQDDEAKFTPLSGGGGQSRFSVPQGGAPAGAAPSVPGVDNPLRPLFPKLSAPIVPLPGQADAAATGAPSFVPPSPSRSADVVGAFRPGDWNNIELLGDTDIAIATFNDGRRHTGIMPGGANGFGQVALYVGPGSGEIRFRHIAVKDLGAQQRPAAVTSPRYRALKLDDLSYAWDTAIADIDRDGHNDVVAGPYYYLGPDFTRRRELYVASSFSPGNQYAANMITHAHDFTGDNWPDILVTEARQMALLVNPRGEPRRWERHMVVPGNISELTLLEDLDDDGIPELILVQAGRVAIAKPAAGKVTEPWPVFFVSGPGARLHGFGAGDIDGDGRKDILQADGWWQQPAGGLFSAEWRFHPYLFGNPEHPGDRVEGGGEMAVVDVNGDGLADVISSINAHGFGLAWYEQVRKAGKIDFRPHLIMGDYRRINPGGLTVSQLHAGVVARDVDGDGVIDFFTGKKRWAHLDSHADPDPNGPAYLLLYRGIRDKSAAGGVRFEPEIISNRAGVGSALTVGDIDGDSFPDVATSGVDGSWVFLSRRPKKGAGQ